MQLLYLNFGFSYFFLNNRYVQTDISTEISSVMPSFKWAILFNYVCILIYTMLFVRVTKNQLICPENIFFYNTFEISCCWYIVSLNHIFIMFNLALVCKLILLCFKRFFLWTIYLYLKRLQLSSRLSFPVYKGPLHKSIFHYFVQCRFYSFP